MDRSGETQPANTEQKMQTMRNQVPRTIATGELPKAVADIAVEPAGNRWFSTQFGDQGLMLIHLKGM